MFGTIVITFILIYMAIGFAFGVAWCLKHYKAGKTVPNDIPWGYLATVLIFMVAWPQLTKRLGDF